MTRSKLLKALKKTGLAVSLVTVMVGATAMSGCGSKSPTTSTGDDVKKSCYNVAEDKFIVINGVLHFGDMYASTSNTTGIGASFYYTDVCYFEFACGEQVLANADYKVFYNDAKPAATEYEIECEGCMTHAS